MAAVTKEHIPVRSGRAASRTGRGEKLSFYVLIALLLYMTVPPLLTMIWISLNPSDAGSAAVSFKAYTNIFSTSRFLQLAVNTLVFAVGSTIFGVFMGTVMAWLVARTDTPWKKLAVATTFVSFAVPAMLRVIGMILLFGENNGLINNLMRLAFGEEVFFNIQSMTGMIVVEGFIWIPLVYLLMVGPLSSMDPSMEESAAIAGANPWFTFRKITIKLLAPSILSVVILMFIRCIQAFEVPLFLGSTNGIQVLTSSIYLDLHESFRPNYAMASAYGSLLVTFLVFILYQYSRMIKRSNRFQTITGKGFRPRLHRLGKWRWLGTAYLAFIFLVTVLPILYVIYMSLIPSLGITDRSIWAQLGLDNYRIMLGYPDIARSILNSLTVGLFSATLAVALAAGATWLIIRSKLRGTWILEQLIGIPLVYPGIVLSLAVLLFYLYAPIPLYGTIWIIVIAYVSNFAPYAMRYTQPALLQVHADLEDSAKVCGANWGMVFRRILMPILTPSLVGAWIFIFFYAIRELSIASLLYTVQTPIVATQILDMWTNGNLSVLSAFGSMIAAISVIVAAFVMGYAQKFGIKV